MKHKYIIRILALALVIALALSTFGCAATQPSETDATPGNSETNDTTSTEPSEDDETGTVLYESASASSAEELLTLFLEEKLIWEKGIYDVEQPTYRAGGLGLYQTIITYDPETGSFRSQSTYKEDDDDGYAEFSEGYHNAQDNPYSPGLYSVDICDYDGDGDAELLAIYAENNMIYFQLFDTEDGKVFSAAKLSLDTLGVEYDYQDVARYQTEDGNCNILIVDNMVRSDTGIYCTYYRLSNMLEPISSLAIDYSSATESFYDGTAEKTYDFPDNGNGGSVTQFLDDYGHGDAQVFCTFYRTQVELNDFIRQYYQKTIEQIRAERDAA